MTKKKVEVNVPESEVKVEENILGEPISEEITDEPKKKSNKSEWVQDHYGNQGWIFYDGFNYWLTTVDDVSGRVGSYPLQPKEFEERNDALKNRRMGKE